MEIDTSRSEMRPGEDENGNEDQDDGDSPGEGLHHASLRHSRATPFELVARRRSTYPPA